MLNLFGRGKKKERRRLVEDALLTRYLEPRRPPSDHAQEDWEESLHKPYKRVIQELKESGDLRRPKVREALQLARVKDIKPVLRELDLKISGRKAELIQRLLENAPDEAMELAIKHARGVVVVTEAGRERALRFQQERQRRRKEAEQKAHQALKRGDVKAACDAVNEFYRWLPSSMRPGIDMDWENREGGVYVYSRRVEYILEDASESWVVKDLPAELRETMLLHAAEDELWPGKIRSETLNLLGERLKELEEPIEPYSRLRSIQAWAHSAEVNERQKELGGTRVWHTVADHLVCEACAPFDGAPEKHWKDRFSHGPPAHDGCRCSTGLTYRTDAQLEEEYRDRQKQLRQAIEGWGQQKSQGTSESSM
jgi:hypothetical protein